MRALSSIGTTMYAPFSSDICTRAGFDAVALKSIILRAAKALFTRVAHWTPTSGPWITIGPSSMKTASSL